MQRTLRGDGVHGLRLQVVGRIGDRLQQFRRLLGRGENLVDQRSVATEQVLDPIGVQSVELSEVHRLVHEREVAVRAHQRNLLGDRRRDGRRKILGRQIDGILAHHPVGGVLPAGDRDQARRHARHRVLAGQLRRLVALPRKQWTQTGVDAVDVLVGERGDQHLVDVAEDVVDVGLGGGRVREVEVPVGVGGADDPVVAPRNHEQHGLLGTQDDRRVAHDPVARNHDVHALRCAHPEPAPLVRERLDLVRPHAGRVDDDVSLHFGGGAGLRIPHAHTGHSVRLAQEADDLRGSAHHRTVVRRGTRDRHRVTGVVDDGVVVADTADQRITLESGRHPQRAGPRQMLLCRNGLRAAHSVVQQEPGRHVRALPPAMGQREEELERFDEMRRERRHRQLPFVQRLRDEPELELFQVAQTPVEHLRRTRRRARREIPRLDERDLQSAGRGVEGRAHTDHPATDHHHVELLGSQLVPRLRPLLRAEELHTRLLVQLGLPWLSANLVSG